MICSSYGGDICVWYLDIRSIHNTYKVTFLSLWLSAHNILKISLVVQVHIARTILIFHYTFIVNVILRKLPTLIIFSVVLTNVQILFSICGYGT